jgi:oxaloacetate decarboxylase alpha subunit
VIAETEQVRRDLGQPIMVTPFPQMVCTQALFNIVGAGRYAQVSDQVIRYVLGKFGRPTRPVDKTVEAAILDRARAREIETEQDFLTLAELRRRFGPTMPDEEFLLRAVMPGDQVDAMLARGRARATYTPEVAPIMSLLKQLAARPASREIVIERPNFRLALKAGPSV